MTKHIDTDKILEEFDKKFPLDIGEHGKRVKSFIKQSLLTAYKQGRNDIRVEDQDKILRKALKKARNMSK